VAAVLAHERSARGPSRYAVRDRQAGKTSLRLSACRRPRRSYRIATSLQSTSEVLRTWAGGVTDQQTAAEDSLRDVFRVTRQLDSTARCARCPPGRRERASGVARDPTCERAVSERSRKFACSETFASRSCKRDPRRWEDPKRNAANDRTSNAPLRDAPAAGFERKANFPAREPGGARAIPLGRCVGGRRAKGALRRQSGCKMAPCVLSYQASSRR
jgi:hypothetical protein